MTYTTEHGLINLVVRVNSKQQGFYRFVADPVTKPGSPSCGYGRSVSEAIGDYVRYHPGETINVMLDDEVDRLETVRKIRQFNKSR